ncbi:MAG TPA: hypothetical protein VGX03_02545, partial [Candidatus Binatia bacterium]|nr:hypothetical protein [Candidatus Binatia bacterium]
MSALFFIPFRKRYAIVFLIGLVSTSLLMPASAAAQQKKLPLPPIQSAYGSQMTPGKSISPASLLPSRALPLQQQDAPIGYEIDESVMRELKLQVELGIVPVAKGTQKDRGPKEPLSVEAAEEDAALGMLPSAPSSPPALVSNFNAFSDTG